MFNMDVIKQNSRKVYGMMIRMYRYTFKELEQISSLNTTELCLALVELLQEGLLEQGKTDRGIYYSRP